ncbi:MAG: endonuclease III domain-containing protein [Candidatus Methanofastidiosia archaeon]
MNDVVSQLQLIREMVYRDDVQLGDPFKVLIKTILSHRTRDENTDKAADRLFAKYPTAKILKSAPLDEVEELIRSTGFYNVKAARIIEVSRIIDEDLGGKVPRSKEELMRLPGVGPKTANCVLVFAYGLNAIPVDAHVHRISNRIGWISTKTPEETEAALEKIVPRNNWHIINELLVPFGKSICRPIKPKCGLCMLECSCRHNQYVFHKKRKSTKTNDISKTNRLKNYE